MRMAGHVPRMGDRRCAYRVFGGRPDGKRQPGRTRRRRKNNNKMESKKWNGGGTVWIALTQDTDRWRALVNVVIDLWVS